MLGTRVPHPGDVISLSPRHDATAMTMPTEEHWCGPYYKDERLSYIQGVKIARLHFVVVVLHRRIMNCGFQVCLFLLGTLPPSLAGSSSSSIRSTLSSSLSSSSATPVAGPQVTNAAANAAAAAAAGAPFLSLRGGSFADPATPPGPSTGFNTALIGVYTGQPALASASPTPPAPLPPAYTAGNYPTPWSDYPSVYPAFNGYQQLDSPGLSNNAYDIPPTAYPGTRGINLSSFGTTDQTAPPGAGYSTGATPGVSSYLVQSINGYSSSSDLNGYPAGTRVQTFKGYVNAPPDGSLPRYIYGQVS